MTAPWPHQATPRTALVCARHDASGRLDERLQLTTQPFASPVKRRWLSGEKRTACTWEA